MQHLPSNARRDQERTHDELGHGGSDQGVWASEDYEWDVGEGDWPSYFDIDEEAGTSKSVQSASGIYVDIFCTRDGVDSFNSFFQTSKAKHNGVRYHDALSYARFANQQGAPKLSGQDTWSAGTLIAIPRSYPDRLEAARVRVSLEKKRPRSLSPPSNPRLISPAAGTGLALVETGNVIGSILGPREKRCRKSRA